MEPKIILPRIFSVEIRVVIVLLVILVLKNELFKIVRTKSQKVILMAYLDSAPTLKLNFLRFKVINIPNTNNTNNYTNKIA